MDVFIQTHHYGLNTYDGLLTMAAKLTSEIQQRVCVFQDYVFQSSYVSTCGFGSINLTTENQIRLFI